MEFPKPPRYSIRPVRPIIRSAQQVGGFINPALLTALILQGKIKPTMKKRRKVKGKVKNKNGCGCGCK